jgi:hypothetical protein
MVFDIEKAQEERQERKEQRVWRVFDVLLCFRDGHTETLYDIKAPSVKAIDQLITKRPDAEGIIRKDCRAKDTQTQKVFTFDDEP